MSQVTNVILHLPLLDDIENKLAEVNKYFGDSLGLQLAHTDDACTKWYGGTKHLEMDIAVAAINYLKLYDFVEYLNSIEWVAPEELQLFVQEQDENILKEIKLHPKKLDINYRGLLCE